MATLAINKERTLRKRGRKKKEEEGKTYRYYYSLIFKIWSRSYVEKGASPQSSGAPL